MPILTPQERLGSVVAGRYTLRAVLGRGGMGVVYRAEHALTGRPVAIKTMAPEHAAEPAVVKRFLREARAAGQLVHPNVVEVLDVGTDDDGAPYMVLELLRGESLAEHLDRKGALPPERALAILLPVLDALSVAHERGIVHRDLKPDNVFLARIGDEVTPKLLDFGIAKLTGDAASFQTRTGTVMGTPAYMAPEQARGEPDVGAGADQWSAGVMLFEALSGRLPFEGDTYPALLGRILTTTAPPLASLAEDVPAAIASAVDRALSRDRTARFESVAAFAAALRDAGREARFELAPPGSPRILGVSEFPARDDPEEGRAPSTPTDAPTAAAGAPSEERGPASIEMARTTPARARSVLAPPTPATGSVARTATTQSLDRPPPRPIARIAVALALALGAIAAVGWAALGGSPAATPPSASPAPSTRPGAAPAAAAASARPALPFEPPSHAVGSGGRGSPEAATDAVAVPATSAPPPAAPDAVAASGGERARPRRGRRGAPPAAAGEAAPASSAAPAGDPMELRGW